MSWTSNAPIHIKFGTVAIWNALTGRKSVNLMSPTLGILKASFDRMTGVNAGIVNEFEEMTSRSLPQTFQDRRAREEMYAANS